MTFCLLSKPHTRIKNKNIKLREVLHCVEVPEEKIFLKGMWIKVLLGTNRLPIYTFVGEIDTFSQYFSLFYVSCRGFKSQILLL